MRPLDPLYVALSAAIVAAGCGSDSTPPNSTKDASAQDAAQSSDSGGTADANTGLDSGSEASTSNDAGSDALPTVRRPFLVGSSMRSSVAIRRFDWSESLDVALELDAATAKFLAKAWLRDALEEHASIAAFSRLTLYLLSVGAPPDLLIASQRASIDEIQHARSCFALARRCDGRIDGPGPLKVEDAVRDLSLEELAFLSAQEGCVGETLGVSMAREQFDNATDPHVRSLLKRLVRDESRHAHLAWRFAAWAIRKGGSPVLKAIEEGVSLAVEQTLSGPVRTYEGINLDALRAHGRMTCVEARECARRSVATIVRPCVEDLRRVAVAGEHVVALA